MPRLFATLALLAFALLLACTSDDPAAPEPSPTAEPTAEPTVSPTPTAQPPATIVSLDLPEGCQLFDEGRWDQRIEAGTAARIELRPASCAGETISELAGTGVGLLVEWVPAGLDGPKASATLAPAAATGRWEGTVTFPEPGTWRADSRLGIGAFVDVKSADYGLVRPSPNLPLPASPQTVAVLDGTALEVLRTFPAEVGGTGLLRDPDRVVFVQSREGGRWLVAGNVATGEIETLLEVGSFTNIVSAPDGRAVAVEWGQPVTGRSITSSSSGHQTRARSSPEGTRSGCWIRAVAC